MMMDKVYLIISEGEMHLKGGNRRYFEQKLISNIDKNLKDIGYDSLYNDILSLIHISEPTRQCCTSRMPSSA